MVQFLWRNIDGFNAMLPIHSPSVISSGTGNTVLSAYEISQQSASVNIFPHLLCYMNLLEEHTQVLHHMISVDESHDVLMDHMVYLCNYGCHE